MEVLLSGELFLQDRATEPMSYSDPSWNCGSLDRSTNTTVSCGTVLAVRELEGNRAPAAMYRNMI